MGRRFLPGCIPLGFAGGLLDSDTGLTRFGFRDYDPDTGRFTAKDPLGHLGSDPDLYGYCLDDPVNRVDPAGLAAQEEDGGLLGGLWNWMVPEAEAASVETDMSSNSTTFDPRPEDPEGRPFTIETHVDVTKDSKPGAGGPFVTDDVSHSQLPAERQFGPTGSYIETNDPRGRDLHGGGPAKTWDQPRQGWTKTFGCTRGQNEDVIEPGRRIDDFKQRHPGVKIPYARK